MARKSCFAAVAAAILLATPALAQQNCQEREALVAKLDEGYSEKLIGRGLQGDARLFEVFMSSDGSSWTIIQSFPTGMSCIMAAGTDWYQDDIASVFAIES